ncbi:hypothetical protein E4T42_04361 [Aureobasidium subglaciale]|nr:hypothetical protein E4T42_04361 [Aureobasidium subglaciale]
MWTNLRVAASLLIDSYSYHVSLHRFCWKSLSSLAVVVLCYSRCSAFVLGNSISMKPAFQQDGPTSSVAIRTLDINPAVFHVILLGILPRTGTFSPFEPTLAKSFSWPLLCCLTTHENRYSFSHADANTDHSTSFIYEACMRAELLEYKTRSTSPMEPLMFPCSCYQTLLALSIRDPKALFPHFLILDHHWVNRA